MLITTDLEQAVKETGHLTLDTVDSFVNTARHSLEKKGCKNAIVLFDSMLVGSPDLFVHWMVTGSTMVLRDMAEPYKNLPIYHGSLSPLLDHCNAFCDLDAEMASLAPEDNQPQ